MVLLAPVVPYSSHLRCLGTYDESLALSLLALDLVQLQIVQVVCYAVGQLASVLLPRSAQVC